MNDDERMMAGKLYNPFKTHTQWLEIRKAVKKFNESDFWKDGQPLEELKKLFKSVGENVVLTPPFYCDHGDKITIGNHFYANTHLTILDENTVTIGNCISHPMSAFIPLLTPLFLRYAIWIWRLLCL